ncbi:MAG TPA: hypothetical protein PKC60_02735 [Hydrogenophaga sp.]|uniref:hypothetical protein n=1 Tax=Hydrogenophaga sp. TaxID=1904254 RepID=UPI002C2EE942|nr:hypothetical protein [Hydrogenophaga sp.]HMN92124.1 hypothetical protein [Hydrogenophaga sp.]HMP10508.1 hypothetical protein [Hydrogenophaga sp.]
MSAPHGWFGRLWRGLFGLLMALAGLVFLVSLMLAGLIAVALLSLWALLTGRKPAPVVVFQRFRQASTRFGQAGWPGSGGRAAGDVVDVQAHEVPEEGLPRVTSPDHRPK